MSVNMMVRTDVFRLCRNLSTALSSFWSIRSSSGRSVMSFLLAPGDGALQPLGPSIDAFYFLENPFLNLRRVLDADPLSAEVGVGARLPGHVPDLNRTDPGDHFRECSADDNIGNAFQGHA